MQLSKAGINEAAEAFIQVNSYLERLKEKKPAARCIKNPRLPEIISESIVYHLISDGKCPLIKIQTGDTIDHSIQASRYQSANGWTGPKRNNTDLVIKRKNGTETLVEVKATQVGYTEFKDKDVDADFIVWVQFNDTFRSGTNKQIEVLVIRPTGIDAKQWNWKPFNKTHSKSCTLIQFTNLKSILV